MATAAQILAVDADLYVAAQVEYAHLLAKSHGLSGCLQKLTCVRGALPPHARGQCPAIAKPGKTVELTHNQDFLATLVLPLPSLCSARLRLFGCMEHPRSGFMAQTATYLQNNTC